MECESFTEVGKGKGKLGGILHLRCLGVYLSIFISTLMSKSRAQGKVHDLIQV